MKYYNVEVSIYDAINLREFLYKNKIHYEASAADKLIHFEILASQEQASMINSFLDTL